MIRKAYETDPLLCPSCGGRMSVVSFIEEPKTIDRIIRHLELTFEAERPPPPHHVQKELLMAAEESKGVFLRAFLVVLCLLEGRVYLKLDGLEISGNLCRLLSL